MENIAQKKWESIDFTVYLRFALPWALLAVVIEIIFRILALRSGAGFFGEYKEYIIWTVRIAAIVFVSWRQLKILGSNTAIAAIAGLIFGTTIGFVSSIYVLIESFKAWKIFNIFSETVFMAILCAAILIVVSSIFKFKNKN